MVYSLNTLAGFPPAIAIGGISLLTTLLAEITDPAPIVTPRKTQQLVPNQTLSSITIAF